MCRNIIVGSKASCLYCWATFLFIYLLSIHRVIAKWLGLWAFEGWSCLVKSRRFHFCKKNSGQRDEDAGASLSSQEFDNKIEILMRKQLVPHAICSSSFFDLWQRCLPLYLSYLKLLGCVCVCDDIKRKWQSSWLNPLEKLTSLMLATKKSRRWSFQTLICK